MTKRIKLSCQQQSEDHSNKSGLAVSLEGQEHGMGLHHSDIGLHERPNIRSVVFSNKHMVIVTGHSDNLHE